MRPITSYNAMSPRVPTLRRLFALSAACLGAVQAQAQLASKSPFLSATAGASSTPTAGAPLEFRGTMQTGQGLKVRIVDPSRKAGVWLLANERDPSFEFTVKQIDADHDTVTVDYQGQHLTLAQHVAKVASAGAAPVGMPNVGANMSPGVAQSVVVNPTPADEQRRLDAVASEVARRRQLREQAAQQVAQGVPVANQVIQQQQQQQLQQTQNPGQQGIGNRGGQRLRVNQP